MIIHFNFFQGLEVTENVIHYQMFCTWFRTVWRLLMIENIYHFITKKKEKWSAKFSILWKNVTKTKLKKTRFDWKSTINKWNTVMHFLLVTFACKIGWLIEITFLSSVSLHLFVMFSQEVYQDILVVIILQQGQGHKLVNFDVTWNCLTQEVCLTNLNTAPYIDKKLQANLSLQKDGQTDMQTDIKW